LKNYYTGFLNEYSSVQFVFLPEYMKTNVFTGGTSVILSSLQGIQPLMRRTAKSMDGSNKGEYITSS